MRAELDWPVLPRKALRSGEQRRREARGGRQRRTGSAFNALSTYELILPLVLTRYSVGALPTSIGSAIWETRSSTSIGIVASKLCQHGAEQRILLACDSSSVAVDTTKRYIARFTEKEKETVDDTEKKSSDILFDAFVSDPSLKDEETDSSFLQDVTAAYEKLMSKESDQQDNSTVKFEKGIAGIVVMVFVLSAVTPPRVDRFLEQVYETTTPGGLLCFRDYGLFDMPMLRFDDDANVACSTDISEDQCFVRGEGTIARFFSTESTKQLFELAGFETIECRYCTVFNNNRKTGQQLKRVFVHGVFKKPI